MARNIGSLSIPGFLWFLIWVVVAIIIIVILALVIHAIAGPNGVNWAFNIGYFHWDIGVS